jgi:hypothetical protein
VSDKSEPWARYEPEPNMGWDLPGMLPGYAAHLARMEALEAQEQRRLEAEARDRAESRREAWRMRRMTELAFQGIPTDGSDMSLMESDTAIAERVFAYQDRVAAAEERRALVEAGLLHLLDPIVEEVATPVADDAPATGVAHVPEPVHRARELLHRATHRAVPCTCPSCVHVRAERTR